MTQEIDRRVIGHEKEYKKETLQLDVARRLVHLKHLIVYVAHVYDAQSRNHNRQANKFDEDFEFEWNDHRNTHWEGDRSRVQD